jgi:prophage DNA circulation protein
MGLNDAIDKVKDLLGLGPDDWAARLGAAVDMTSPSGKTFSPKWIGNARSMDKKLGIFTYPKLAGNVVQDLEVNSTRYPLTLYFDGKDCDLAASAFFAAAAESGPWDVVHPVHGYVQLQLVSISEQAQPVTSGGIVVFDTEWIEPIDPDELVTARELQSNTEEAVKDLNISAAQQFADNIKQGAESATAAIAGAADIVQGVMDKATSPLFDSLDALNSVVNSVQTALQSTITQAEIIADSLAGQIQQLAQLPALGSGSGSAMLDAYDDAIDAVSERLPLTGIPAAADVVLVKNGVAVYELALNATIGAVATVAISAPLVTRADALAAAERIGDTLLAITASLDAAQEAFSGQPADLQYASNGQTFAAAERAVSLATRYLLAVAPDLKSERRQILEEPKTPVQCVVEAYGSLGDDGELLDLFIEANKLGDTLDGDGILMLDRGTEVVTYA